MRIAALALLLAACTGNTTTTPAPDAMDKPADNTPTEAEDKASRLPDSAIKKPGNLPVRTESELAAEDAARQTCLDGCAENDDCKAGCMNEHPIMQVEVVPDGPLEMPEPPAQPE